MQIKPTVTFRDIPQSAAVFSRIDEKIQKLGHLFNKIMHCDVMIEQDQKHKRQGKLYAVRLSLTVPKEELVVNKVHNENIYVAIQEAFKAIERKLKSFSKRRHGVKKRHQSLLPQQENAESNEGYEH